MPTANVHEAKTHLSRLLDAVERGEQVIITRRGPGINRFAVVPAPAPARDTMFGALHGQIRYADDFDESDADVRRLFDDASQ